MPEIKAGPELDKAVAEAIGAKFIGDGLEGLRYGPVYKLGNERFSLFSEDMNASFAAAGKVGLFDPDGLEAFLCRHPAAEEEWKVWWEDETSDDGGNAVYRSTPALAICAAILELAKVSA